MKIYMTYFIKWAIQLYSLPSIDSLMASELEEAKRDLLVAETASDYAESAVVYNRQRIERLTCEIERAQRFALKEANQIIDSRHEVKKND